MQPIPIQVRCYSGHKADESPRSFLCEGSEVEVEQVRDRWLASGRDPKQPKADCFKVAGKDGHDYLLRHDLGSDEWYLENRW